MYHKKTRRGKTHVLLCKNKTHKNTHTLTHTQLSFFVFYSVCVYFNVLLCVFDVLFSVCVCVFPMFLLVGFYACCCCCFTVFFWFCKLFFRRCLLYHTKKTQRGIYVWLRKKSHLNTHTHTNTHNCVCVFFRRVCVHLNLFLCVCANVLFSVCVALFPHCFCLMLFFLRVFNVLLLCLLSCFFQSVKNWHLLYQ